MKTYCVTVTREMNVTQSHELEIEAEDEEAAREQAESEMENISDDDWSEESSVVDDLEITKVEEVSDDEERGRSRSDEQAPGQAHAAAP